MPNPSIVRIVALTLFAFALHAKALAEPTIPDIRTLPRLRAGLPVGTLAWATVDQLHASQPQTGLREVYRKAEKFEGMLSDDHGKFPDELYEYLMRKQDFVPVYIGKTPPTDSRYGREEVLGWVIDRTHSSNALTHMIEKVYGKAALSTPIYSKKNRPVNFVIVQIEGDESGLNRRDFAKFMVEGQHCYLQDWSRGPKGTTLKRKIAFWNLPERVNDTTDNPYRGMVGRLQHERLLGRSATNFSQFTDAEALLKNKIVSWDEISLDASDKTYAKAIKRAGKFFASSAAAGLPGTKELQSCDGLLKK